MLHIVVRRREDLLFRVVEGAVVVVGERDRAGHGLHILGVRIGIAEGQSQAVVILLGRTQRQRERLVGHIRIRQHESIEVRAVIVGNRHVERHAVAVRSVNTARARSHEVGAADDGRIGTVEDERVKRERPRAVDERRADVHIRRPCGTQRVFPVGWDLEVGIDIIQLEVGALAGRDLVGQHARNRIARTVRHAVLAQHIVEIEQVDADIAVADARTHLGDVGAGIGVGHPNIRVAAREPAEAAPDLQRVGRVPGEAEARLPQLFAVEVLRVRKAVLLNEVRVLDRQVVGVVAVIAKSGDKREVVRQRDLVLGEQCHSGVAPLGGRVVDIAGHGTIELDLLGNAGLERFQTAQCAAHAIGHRGEAHFGLGLLHEQVEHVQVLILDACAQRVFADLVVGGASQRQHVIVEIVRTTRVVRAEIVVDPALADTEFAEIGSAFGDLAAVQLQIGCAKLCGECLGPVGVERAGVGQQLGTALIEVVGELELVRIAVRAHDVVAVIVVERAGCAVLVADVPIEFHQHLLVEVRVAGGRAAGLVLVELARSRRDAVDDLLVEARRGCVDVGAFELFVGRVEEQLVLDDRATDADAVADLVEIAEIELGRVRLVAAQSVIRVVDEGRAAELVGARLGHGVDVARREAAIDDVERRDLHADLLDRVEREGLALGRVAIGVQAEAVIDRHAVQRGGVEARVLADALDGVDAAAALVHEDARVEAQHVGDVAVDGRCVLQGFQTEGRARPDGEVGDDHALADHDDLVRDLGGQAKGERGRIAQRQHHILDALALIAGSGDGDVIGTGDGQAAHGEIAGGIGGDDAGETRLVVDEAHGRIRDRRAGLCQHDTVDGRRRNLGERSRGQHGGGQGRGAEQQGCGWRDGETGHGRLQKARREEGDPVDRAVGWVGNRFGRAPGLAVRYAPSLSVL